MFCPSCGKEILTDRNFCSICGINLQAVHQAIANPVTQPQNLQTQQPSEIYLEVEKARHSLKKLALILMGAGLSLSILLVMISEFLRDFSDRASRILENLAPLGALLILIGIMTLIYRRLMYGAASSKVVVLQSQQSLSQTPPLNLLPADSNYQNPPGRPLFQDMASQTSKQQPIPVARQNHDSSYPYPPPTITEHTTKELKPPQGKQTTSY